MPITYGTVEEELKALRQQVKEMRSLLTDCAIRGHEMTWTDGSDGRYPEEVHKDDCIGCAVRKYLKEH